jgi:hypothetical protein
MDKQLLMEKEISQQMDWKRRVFGIGLKRIGLQASRLIHPGSLFAQGVVFVSSILLLYTAIVTPFIVAFFWNVAPCHVLPTLEFDMFSDVFFLTEILLTFVTGINQNGIYIDDWRQVTM